MVHSFKPKSRYLSPSNLQEKATRALRANTRSGFVVLPCGVGKSAVLAQAILDLPPGSAVLVLLYERLAVEQFTALLKTDTTLKRVSIYSGNQKQALPAVNATDIVVTISTYGSLANVASKGSISQKLQAEILSRQWTLLLLDEAHHAVARTYRTIIETLDTQRTIGATATLVRHELLTNTERGEQDLGDHEERVFSFIGPVLFRATLKDACDAGILADTRRLILRTRVSPEFALVMQNAPDARAQLLTCHPEKLNAIALICAFHAKLGHQGVVFTQSLFTANALLDMLGPRWRLLSGSAANGEALEQSHSATSNHAVVKGFNSGEVAGIIATSVAESAVDLNSPRFAFAVLANFHAGRASAVQRIGRLSRTPRLRALAGESARDLGKRQRELRKVSHYYELPTVDTEEEEAVAARDQLFSTEGYSASNTLEASELLALGRTERAALPFASRSAQMRMARSALSYKAKAHSQEAARATAKEIKKPVATILKHHRQQATDAKTSVMRELARRRIAANQKRMKKITVVANEAYRAEVAGTSIGAEGEKLLTALADAHEEEAMEAMEA